MKNNLHLIISDDNKVIEFNLNKILKKINYEPDSKIKFDLSNKTLGDIVDEASMISLFSTTKVILGDNFNLDKTNDSDIEYLTKYINNANPNTYIILIADKIDARKKSYKVFKDNFNIINSEEINNETITEYVRSTLKEHKYKMTDFDIEYFVNKVGYDILNINSELDKLYAYKSKEKEINRYDIDLLVLDNIEYVMYEFTNAILDKDYDKITTMYNKFKKDNISPDYLIASIAGSIRTNLIIKLLNKEGKNNFDIAKIIGKKEFFVKKSIERLYKYTVDDLTNTLGELSLIDRRIKMGKTNIDELELFILNK